MFKQSITFAAVALAFAASAFSDEPIEVSLSHEYDSSRLGTNEGFEELQREIKAKARRLCMIDDSSVKESLVDRTCQKQLVSSALREVYRQETAKGRTLASGFDAYAEIRVAQAE